MVTAASGPGPRYQREGKLSHHSPTPAAHPYPKTAQGQADAARTNPPPLKHGVGSRPRHAETGAGRWGGEGAGAGCGR